MKCRRPCRRWSAIEALIKTLEEQKKSTDDVVGGVTDRFSPLLVRGTDSRAVPGLQRPVGQRGRAAARHRHPAFARGHAIQVARLFAGEAMLLGAVGAVLGIPLGIFLAETAINLVKEDLNSVFLNPDIRPIATENDSR